jgi:6-pyruvoyl-tetrahydropterin synthase
MTHLAQAFGANFNKDNVRIRSFEFGGHTFKVKVPLTSEYESILEQANNVSDEVVNKYYDQITKEFINNKDKITEDMGVVFLENDVIVKEKSMREAAKNKTITENRIVAMVRLLVPEEKDFDMATITYDMVEELFPFPVQLELIDLISNTIAPNYKDQKGK